MGLPPPAVCPYRPTPPSATPLSTHPPPIHPPASASNCVLPQRSSQASVSTSTISTASEWAARLQGGGDTHGEGGEETTSHCDTAVAPNLCCKLSRVCSQE